MSTMNAEALPFGHSPRTGYLRQMSQQKASPHLTAVNEDVPLSKLEMLKLDGVCHEHSAVTREPSSAGVSREGSVDISHHSPQSQMSASPFGSGYYASPIQRPKVKGEAMPKLDLQKQTSPVRNKDANKIFDEAHHFGLCEHYSMLLDKAKEIGFENVKWPTGFTLFHLAAKKNNKCFIDWLKDNDCRDIHAIDDFGKKPIDYACPHKKDSVHDQLEALMKEIPAINTKEEIHYQAVKNGTYVPKKKKAEEKVDMSKIMENDFIAEGDTGNKKPADLMTQYEAEQTVPSDYKKCFKQLSNGWSEMKAQGKWPNGMSMLHWAARNGKDELCRFLVIEYNADPNEEDASGHSAIYHAKLKKHRKLCKKLITRFRKEM